MFSMPLFIGFGDILGRISEGYGAQLESQGDQKIDLMDSSWQVVRNSKNTTKTETIVFDCFSNRFSSILDTILMSLVLKSRRLHQKMKPTRHQDELADIAKT